jgi:hypothetical protein
MQLIIGLPGYINQMIWLHPRTSDVVNGDSESLQSNKAPPLNE